MSITVRDVNRALRQKFWPLLESKGFSDHTDRVGWRRNRGVIDVVELPSVGAQADIVGCTSFSFSACVAASSSWMPTIAPLAEAPLRPHFWQCDPFLVWLDKELKQPWFEPFTRSPKNLTPPMRAHREGLKHMLRTDVHDRPDIWFVLEDGSNLDEVLKDLTAMVMEVGLEILGRLHEPQRVIEMVLEDELASGPGSPIGQEVLKAARAELDRTTGERA